MSNKPLTSVIIPVYNGERFLRQAIDSVVAQTGTDIDVIVVDDGSSDASASIAESYGEKIRCLRQENGGAARARNTGISASSGSMLAFLDADDVWLPNKLASQLELLDSDATLDAVFGLVDHISEDGNASVNVEPAAAGLIAGTMLIRRDSFLRVGPFTEERGVGEFIDWYGRAQDAGLRHEMLQQVVLRRRIHTGNMTRTLSHAGYLQTIRATLDRRRRTAG